MRASAYLEKASRPYDSGAVGVVSTEPGIELGKEEFKNQPTRPVGIGGRVPVKATNENGAIKPGDYLTTSSLPGYAMKATRSGTIIGRALDYFDARQGTVMIFLDVHYRSMGWRTEVNDTFDGELQGIGSSTPNTFVIDQKGTGDLLQLQKDGIDRLLVNSDGAVQILAEPRDEQPENRLFVIKSKDAEIFSINIRGDVGIKGAIVVEKNSFAGSIVTNEAGAAEVNFDYHLGTGKPSVQLTAEGEEFALAQIAQFFNDELGNYTGFELKAAKLKGGDVAASTTVHYLVVAKPDGYETASATPIRVISPEESASTTPEIIVVESPNAGLYQAEFPVISINGNNPARIEVGATYLDLGAIVTDDKDNNLGVQVSGAEIDTSQIGTSTVTYTATDNDGNTTTATREVVVYDSSPPEPVPEPAPEPEPEAISAPSPVPEPTPEPDPVPEPVPEPAPEPEPEAIPASSPVPEPTQEPVPVSEPDLSTTTPAETPPPIIEPEPIVAPQLPPEPIPEPEPAPIPEPEPAPATSPEPAPNPEPVVVI
ncbi:MAG: DUF5011 domain-containing protein [Patescibacteria group bacterium]